MPPWFRTMGCCPFNSHGFASFAKTTKATQWVAFVLYFNIKKLLNKQFCGGSPFCASHLH